MVGHFATPRSTYKRTSLLWRILLYYKGVPGRLPRLWKSRRVLRERDDGGGTTKTSRGEVERKEREIYFPCIIPFFRSSILPCQTLLIERDKIRFCNVILWFFFTKDTLSCAISEIRNISCLDKMPRFHYNKLFLIKMCVPLLLCHLLHIYYTRIECWC